MDQLRDVLHRYGLIGAGVLLVVGVGLAVLIASRPSDVERPRPLAAISTAVLPSTGTPTSVASPTAQPTGTPTPTATWTPSPSATWTVSPTATWTATPSPFRPTATPTTPPVTPSPTPFVAPPGLPPGVPYRLTAPSIELDTPVESWDLVTDPASGRQTWETRPWVAGWYRFTNPVGQAGNAVIAGHVADREGGHVFARLKDLRPGDTLEVATVDHRFTYVVRQTVAVDPTDVQWVQPTIDPILTLITCDGQWLPDQRRYTQRLVVVAQLVGS